MNYRIVYLLVLLEFLLRHSAWIKQGKIGMKEVAVLSQTFQENAGPQSLSPRLSQYIILYNLITRRHVRRVTDSHLGARGGVVVKALRYKLAGRGFDSR
jgi:hypothetical protein